jgi:hypothetical protein
VDVVERLHDVRPGQVPLEYLAVGELPRFEFRDGVAEHDVQSGVDRQAGERAADVSAADESKCCHASDQKT